MRKCLVGRDKTTVTTKQFNLNTLEDGVYREEELCNTDQTNQDEKILPFFNE